MTVNEGTLDRALRLILGIVGIGLVFIGPKSPLGWIGLIPLATAAIGFCPLYRLFGVSTCKPQPKT